ncbi:radical SAM protein [Anaerocolumna sedimenticola]|uniref:Radical SAM protein n=1 Tax=Anaerocolumna sedimenticola TaxID=2696063 RepID=A0A6P1TPV5_9FIRM|nr:radical SAM protein [Anaerocolumna sedimenticola]QHQ61428.1 radical SAM protein [Anaerocolumna sedimenticola]
MDKNLLKDCTLCPRNCHIDRTMGQIGACRETEELVVARAALHMWEEPCISGEKGSGTVFFSGCALGCVYCQNHNIAKGLAGKRITIERLSDIFMEIQDKRANNINLVTPGHFIPQIMEVIDLAKAKGLHLPIVYNSSGYEKAETIKLLKGYVDVYLPDLKYKSGEISKKYSNAENYFEYAAEAIQEMVRQTGEPVFDEDGIMVRGVIVRHLTLPGCLKDSKDIMEYLYETFGNHIYISIMNQYTPLSNVIQYPEINRKITEEEYDELIDYALYLGVENGFIQEGETASESFIPEFNEEGV